MSSSLKGTLLTSTLAYDGGRQVTVYMPPRPPEAIVFAGDGQTISQYIAGLEGATDASIARPTMLVGAHSLADETQRLHEYSAALDAARFAAHEHFFVREVRRFAQEQFGVAFPPHRTAVFGASAGGELALALGLRHPDVYGAVCCASPGGGFRPSKEVLSRVRLPRVYLVAGTQEPFFRENALRWAVALRGAGAADVVLEERAGEHGGPFWRDEFPRMLAWAFEG